MAFIDFGEKGRPVVFLHGWQQDKKSLTPLVPYLYKKYRLYFLDLPGFGKSAYPGDDFTSRDYAREVVDWMAEKKLRKPFLVGHSFGGKVASLVAAEQPKLISGLILISSAGLPEKKLFYPVSRLVPQRVKKMAAPLLASSDYKNAGKMLPVFKNVVKEDLLVVWPKIRIPTLVIWGEKDEELPVDQAFTIHNLIKGSLLKIVEGGHFPFSQQPELIANLIADFIEK